MEEPPLYHVANHAQFRQQNQQQQQLQPLNNNNDHLAGSYAIGGHSNGYSEGNGYLSGTIEKPPSMRNREDPVNSVAGSASQRYPSNVPLQQLDNSNNNNHNLIYNSVNGKF